MRLLVTGASSVAYGLVQQLGMRFCLAPGLWVRNDPAPAPAPRQPVHLDPAWEPGALDPDPEPLCLPAVCEGAVGGPLLVRLQQEFSTAAPFWEAHDYSNNPFFSYLLPLVGLLHAATLCGGGTPDPVCGGVI